MKKFRICYTAQDGSKKLIYNDDRYLIGLDGKVYENYGMDWKTLMWENLFDSAEPELLQQFTGAMDRHGKEIWEGDVVDYDGRRGSIVLFACSFRVDWGDQTDSDLGYMIDKLEVIGNVFGI